MIFSQVLFGDETVHVPAPQDPEQGADHDRVRVDFLFSPLHPPDRRVAVRLPQGGGRRRSVEQG